MTFVETVRDVLVTLARRCAFREIAALIGEGYGGLALDTAAQVQQLCAYGQRLMDLDAEDFATADAVVGSTTDSRVADAVEGDAVPAHLLARGRACRMPQAPREQPRDALASLHPAYALLLETIAVRWQRHETAGVVAGCFIASEYAPLLAWEQVLGHAGDPERLGSDPLFAGPESLFGSRDERCPHPAAQRSAARRSLHASKDSTEGWRSYLDTQHSVMAKALRTCAAQCKSPCSVVSSLALDDHIAVQAACRASLALSESAIVRLRHAAPVGHGFGVPSSAEVLAAWERSRTTIAARGGPGAAALIDDGFPLAGMPSLLSAIAGTQLRPDTLVADTAAEVIAALERGAR
jgi:hypothetical protein